MRMNVNELSRDEFRNLMKHLSIVALRIPVKENVKLYKKYITGFRASSVTYIQLVPLYFQEIHNANKDVERALLSSVNKYLEERGLREQIELLDDQQEWKNCVQMGIELGNSMCEIDFEIIIKIFSIDMPIEKIEAIAIICNQLCEQHKNMTTTISEHEKEKQDLETLIEKLNRDKSNLEDKKKSANKQRDVGEKELKGCNDLLKQTQAEFEKKNTVIKEHEVELKKNAALISGQEQSLKDYKEKLSDSDLQIKDLKEEIVAIEKELSEHNEKKINEYNAAIDKLVIDTIEDLKENYSLDAQQFDKIINSIDGEHNVYEVWRRLSDINASIIADIEVAMRSNIVTTDIIDRCDDVENNILVKYIILKAIKSLYFEYLSRNEQKSNISDIIFRK